MMLEPVHLVDFERRLRIRIAAWLDSPQGKDHRLAEEIRKAPDLFCAVVRLLLDTGVDEELRPLLVATVIYVVCPSDMLPEGLMGPVGFADDVVLMALVLDRVRSHGQMERARVAWQAEGELDELLDRLLGDGREILGETLWTALNRWVEAS